MKNILRNVLGVIAGLFIGSAVNMGILMALSQVLPLPEGVDMSNAESIKDNIHLFGVQHFITPFLAHALGTLAGAFIAVKIVASHHFSFAMAIGVLFLAGGIANCFMIPAPAWFMALDLIVAYIPMAYLGHKLAR